MGASQLQKMKLVGYKDKTFAEDKKTGHEYEVLINPETYALTYGTETNQKTAQGSSEIITSFNKRSPQTLNFKFLFDGTGVIKKDNGILAGLASGLAIPGLSAKLPDITEDIGNFKKVVYDFGSSTHAPSYVQLRWGVLLYNCQLTRMTITFKLFKPDGTPLRAEADCSFQGVIDEEKLAAIENRQSPDLTRIRTVTEGDTLPLLCFREYGDSRYYYQVASVNKLTDMKRLKPGMKLIFPPIETN